VGDKASLSRAAVVCQGRVWCGVAMVWRREVYGECLGLSCNGMWAVFCCLMFMVYVMGVSGGGRVACVCVPALGCYLYRSAVWHACDVLDRLPSPFVWHHLCLCEFVLVLSSEFCLYLQIYSRVEQPPVPPLWFPLCLCIYCQVGYEWALRVLFPGPDPQFCSR
jgi:hypothetical protein